MAEIDEEFIDITLVKGDKEGLGFNIRGGKDMPHIPEDTGIFVTKIRENGAAAIDGRLSEGDKIIEVNGQQLNGITHKEAVTSFQRAGNTVRLKVQRDAERKITEATYNQVNPKRTQSYEAVFISIGAILVLGTLLYKCRNPIREGFSKILSWPGGSTSRSYGLNIKPPSQH